jgi:hypothetical protein
MKPTVRFITINPQSVGGTVLVLFFGFSSCKKSDTIEMNGKVSYSGSFVKSGDAVVTSATGTATATFDPATLALTYMLAWNNLTSNAANMHFHDAGPVIYPITGFAAATSGTFSGSVTLTAAQAADLSSGKIYAQIHTVNIPGGEIKATLSKNSAGYTPPGGGYVY